MTWKTSGRRTSSTPMAPFTSTTPASSFGTNRSAIGVATTTTPGDLDSWVDHGPILTSQQGDDYNAIDPQVFFDGQGWHIVYGSFWTGIQMQPLADDMRTPGAPRLSLASNPVDPPNAIENATDLRARRPLVLAVSWDFCCRGLSSTYRVAVGRSESPTGPFVDADGVPMAEGGGTILLIVAATRWAPARSTCSSTTADCMPFITTTTLNRRHDPHADPRGEVARRLALLLRRRVLTGGVAPDLGRRELMDDADASGLWGVRQCGRSPRRPVASRCGPTPISSGTRSSARLVSSTTRRSMGSCIRSSRSPSSAAAPSTATRSTSSSPAARTSPASCRGRCM